MPDELFLDLQVDLNVYDGRVSVVREFQIKDVVQLTGFSASTLRYYEEIGLVPQPARTPSGYRVYEAPTIELLAFIARAKQLGCTLEEIRVLATAWTGGQCGPVQDQLRRLVAEILAETQRHITQLVTLTGDLHQAARQLELHRPNGPCDDECGCVNATTDVTTTRAESLTTKPIADTNQPPIACTLDATAMRTQQHEWRSLLAHVTQRWTIPGGVRIELDHTIALGELARLASAEHACCRFFEFAITFDERGVALEVRAPRDAAPLVDSLFGVPS